MKKQSLRISMIASPIMLVCAVLVSLPLARGEGTDEGACSNRTLQGDYGFAIEGLVLPAPGVVVPIRGVALTRFDGKGNLSQVDHLVINGTPPALDWTPGAGTYHVDPDCTGIARINIPSTSDFVNLRFVVVKQGKEIHTVVAAPFNGPARTVTSVGIKTD